MLRKVFIVGFVALMVGGASSHAADLTLAAGGRSDYQICLLYTSDAADE